MAGAAGLEQVRSAIRDGDTRHQRKQQRRERDHAGGWSVSIITSRLVPDSPPHA